jgi:hypothetical protein
MSGWIKWEKDLESDPRVLRMARELKRICNACVTLGVNPVTLVCGGLIRLWSYADSHARDDDTIDLGCKELDELIGIDNFTSIMPADWLREIDENTVELPNFQAHNGIEAKKKALTQKRVETHRKRTSVTRALTTALPDQDQDQDHKKTPSVSSARTRATPRKRCPDDFKPSDEDRDKIRAECPDVDLTAEERKFRDHEFARGRSDWLATWRNWMREAQARAAARPNGKHAPQPPKRPPPTVDEIAAEHSKAAAENRIRLAELGLASVLKPMPQ